MYSKDTNGTQANSEDIIDNEGRVCLCTLKAQLIHRQSLRLYSEDTIDTQANSEDIIDTKAESAYALLRDN